MEDSCLFPIQKSFYFYKLPILCFIIIVLLFISCNKKTPNPISPDDNYTPQLLDPAGTVYVGIYFPLGVGLTWKYSKRSVNPSFPA
jgi:hypothetical protein